MPIRFTTLAGSNKIDPPLRGKGAIREANVGAVRLMLMRAADVVRVARELLRADPAALLCDDPGCERCRQARVLLGKAEPPRECPRRFTSAQLLFPIQSPASRPARAPSPENLIGSLGFSMAVTVEIVLPGATKSLGSRLWLIGGHLYLPAMNEEPTAVAPTDLPRPVSADNDLIRLLLTHATHVLIAQVSIFIRVGEDHIRPTRHRRIPEVLGYPVYGVGTQGTMVVLLRRVFPPTNRECARTEWESRPTAGRGAAGRSLQERLASGSPERAVHCSGSRTPGYRRREHDRYHARSSG